MKKYFVYSVMILFVIANCSNALFAQSAKDKFDALNNYFETVEKDPNKKIIITSEKVSSNMTLRILKTNEIQAIDSDGKRKGDETFYQKKDWEIMKKKYENTSLTEKDHWLEDKYWKKNDFRHKEIIFESVKGRPGDALFYKYVDGLNFDVYSFSELIFYQNKKYLVFTVFKYNVVGGGSTYIVAMKKKQGKWIRTHEGYPDWFN